MKYLIANILCFVYIVVADTNLEPNSQPLGPILYNTTIPGGPYWSIEWDP